MDSQFNSELLTCLESNHVITKQHEYIAWGLGEEFSGWQVPYHACITCKYAEHLHSLLAIHQKWSATTLEAINPVLRDWYCVSRHTLEELRTLQGVEEGWTFPDIDPPQKDRFTITFYRWTGKNHDYQNPKEHDTLTDHQKNWYRLEDGKMFISAYMDTVLIRIESALDLIDRLGRGTTLNGFNWAELLTILNQARTRTAELLEGKVN